MGTREVFEEAGNADLPVMYVRGSAADNAAETVKKLCREDGEHSDEFLLQWGLSVSSVLSDLHNAGYFTKKEVQEARDWFEARGITY